jgi:hypothetical protein
VVAACFRSRVFAKVEKRSSIYAAWLAAGLLVRFNAVRFRIGELLKLIAPMWRGTVGIEQMYKSLNYSPESREYAASREIAS